MCAGFKAGGYKAHHLVNETDEDVVYLQIGDRALGDEVTSPDDDIRVVLLNGERQFTHKDGQLYQATG